jgi:hypothetical protein
MLVEEVSQRHNVFCCVKEDNDAFSWKSHMLCKIIYAW